MTERAVWPRRRRRLTGFLVGAPRGLELGPERLGRARGARRGRRPSSSATSTPRPQPAGSPPGSTSHYAIVPATDPALVDAWFRVGFGHQHVHAIREPWSADAVVEVPPELVTRARRPRDDIHALARIDVALPAAPGIVPRLLVAPAAHGSRSHAPSTRPTSTIPRFATFVVEHEGEVVGAAVGCPIEVSSGAQEPHAAARRRLPRLRSGAARASRSRCGTRARRGGARVVARRGPSQRRHRLAHDEPAVVTHLAAARLPADVLPALSRDRLVDVGEPVPHGLPSSADAPANSAGLPAGKAGLRPQSDTYRRTGEQ